MSTEADGRFEIGPHDDRWLASGLPRRSLTLVATYPGEVARVDVPWRTAGRVDAGDIVLAPALTVSVQVLDERDRPFAGASVGLCLDAAEADQPSTPWFGGAESDDDGWARFPPIPRWPESRLRLSVADPGLQPFDGEWLLSADVADDLRFTVAVARGRTVTGRVLHRSGRPAVGHRVARRMDYTLAGSIADVVTVNDDGTFSVSGVPVEDTVIDVFRPPGEIERMLARGDPGVHPGGLSRGTFEVPAGTSALGDLMLPELTDLRIRVLDPTGRPVSRGDVALVRSDRHSGRGRRDCWVGEDGVARFAEVASGTYRAIVDVVDVDGERWRATGHGFDNGYGRLIVAPAAGVVELPLNSGGRVVVRLLDGSRDDSELSRPEVDVRIGRTRYIACALSTRVRFRVAPDRYPDLRLRIAGFEPCVVGPVTVCAHSVTKVDARMYPLPTDSGRAADREPPGSQSA